jgi:hypothetical protein
MSSSQPRSHIAEDETCSLANGMDPPRWLVVAAYLSAGAVFSLGMAGLLLAATATYRPSLAFALAALIFAALTALVVPSLPKRNAPSTPGKVVAVVGVTLIAAITVWNGANASQHVLVNRDPGAYTTAGRWIARDGSLEVRPKVGAFRGVDNLVLVSGDMWQVSTDPPRLQFQGAHFLPALLAEAYAVDGDRGLFLLPTLLGGLALLQFFVLAWRLLRRPIFAIAAMGALAFTLPEVSFARDAFSEIVVQVLLFGALVLLVDRRIVPHWRAALGGGLLLGAIQATRIDAALLFIAIPVLMTVAWLHAADDAERRHVRASNRALATGLLPGVALGLFDLMVRSERYWSSLWRNERHLLIATVAIAVLCAALAKVWPRLSPLVSTLRWNRISSAAGIVVIVTALAAWVVRPLLLPLHLEVLAALQRGGHLTIRPVTLKFENSMSWMAWYLGPLTLLAAIVAGGCLTRAILRGHRLYALTPLALFVPETLVYLWYANIYTDHVWVARRFVTSALPMLILLAVGLAALLWRAPLRGKLSPPSRLAAIAITVGAVGFPLWTILPVRSMREQGGYATTVKHACNVLGPRAAVVVLQPTTLVSDTREGWMLQTLRSWCGVPVGALGLSMDTRKDLLSLASEWRKVHRNLVVVAAAAEPIRQVLPEAKLTPVAPAVNRRLLTQSFAHRPAGYETQSFPLFVGTLDQ